MPDFDSWLHNSARAWPGEIADDPDFIVNRLPVSITLGRGSATLAAQTVRLATLAGGSSGVREGGGRAENSAANADVVLVGSSTLDVQRGDIFKHLGVVYTVVYVDKTMPTKVEARARAQQ